MNALSINVNIKNKQNTETLVLYQKIYSTPYGIVNQWSTDINSEYRLEIVMDEDDLSVNPSKISKSLNIETDEWSIADQMMLKLYKSKSVRFKDQDVTIK